MAISTPVLTASRFDQVNAATTALPTSGTVTLTADRLYVMFAGCDRATTPDWSTGAVFTHSGSAKTWNYITQSAAFDSARRRIAAFWYIPPSTEAAIAITIDPDGGTNSNNVGAIIEMPAGFVAATPIAQSASAVVTTAALSIAVALGAAPTAGNLSLFGCWTYGVTSALDPRTNWTELSDDQGLGTANDSGTIETQYKTDLGAEQTASCSVASTNRQWGGIHLELAAIADAALNPPPIRSVRQAVQRAANW